MPSKKEKKTKKSSDVSSSKVALPNFLDPELPLYTTEYYYACFYTSSVLIDYIFLPGDTYLKIEQLGDEMNKITTEGEYKNEKLSVVDADTNKKMVKILSKYDPYLACWHNFHALILVTHYIVVAGNLLKHLKNWEADVRYYAWLFLLRHYKTSTAIEGFESNDYLEECFNLNEGKKTFKKWVKYFCSKELWSLDAMEAPSQDGFWHNVKCFLIDFCQDPPEVAGATKRNEPSSVVVSNTPKGRKKARKNVPPPVSSLVLLDTAISLHQGFNSVPEDTNILSNNDLQHHMRKMLVAQDRVNIKNLETIACRQIEVEKELSTVKLKLKKELAELAEQAEHVTELIISNRLNLVSTLESQIQTSGKYQPLIDLQDDLKSTISACTDPKMLLEGIRAKIENDGDKYQRFDYFPPHSFEKILPLTVAQDEVKTVENESSIVTGLQVGSTEHVCVDVPVEHVEVEKPLSKKRKLTQDVVGNDSDNVLLPPPVHNRVTRGAIAIKNTNAKNKPLNLISSDENDDDLDDDGVHESLSPDEVASLLDTVQDGIVPQDGSGSLQVGSGVLQVGSGALQVDSGSLQVGSGAVQDGQDDDKDAQDAQVDPGGSKNDPDVSQVGKLIVQGGSSSLQDGSNVPQDGKNDLVDSQVGQVDLGDTKVGQIDLGDTKVDQIDLGDTKVDLGGTKASQVDLGGTKVDSGTTQVDLVTPQVDLGTSQVNLVDLGTSGVNPGTVVKTSDDVKTFIRLCKNPNVTLRSMNHFLHSEYTNANAIYESKEAMAIWDEWLKHR